MLGNYLCFRAPTVWGGFGNSSPAPHPVYLPPSSSTLKSWNLGRETCPSRLPNGLNPRHPGALHPTRSHLSCSGPLSRGSRASLYPALLCPAHHQGLYRKLHVHSARLQGQLLSYTSLCKDIMSVGLTLFRISVSHIISLRKVS